MCKVMIMAGIKPETREAAWSFIKEMAKEITPGNVDGLGYAAMSETGELFGERWHHNSEAFTVRETAVPVLPFEQRLLSTYKGAIKRRLSPAKYNKFGSVCENITAITLHSRMATSGKEFVNTHPFVVGETSLIHNGVIRNASSLEMKQSTCDSETILNLYVKHKVFNQPEAIQRVAKKLLGYYACGVFSNSKKQGRILDIFKCDSANLAAAYVKELGTVVFSTRVDDIKSVCARLGFTVEHEFLFASETLLRLDALTGEVLQSVKFDATFGMKVEHRDRPAIRSWKEKEPQERIVYQGGWWKGEE